jgi:hypothetical protein
MIMCASSAACLQTKALAGHFALALVHLPVHLSISPVPPNLARCTSNPHNMASVSARAGSLPTPIVIPPSGLWDGNDGLWSTFSINVGTPGQEFRLLMSTAASCTYVPLDGVCPGRPNHPPSSCVDSRGVLPFHGGRSDGFQTTRSSSWVNFGIYASPFDVGLGLSLEFNTSYGVDTVRLGPSSDTDAFTLAGQNVAGFLDDRFWLGFFGLSNQPDSFSRDIKPLTSFFGNLNLSMIPSFSYSYGAGAAYRKPRHRVARSPLGSDIEQKTERFMAASLSGVMTRRGSSRLALASTSGMRNTC